MSFNTPAEQKEGRGLLVREFVPNDYIDYCQPSDHAVNNILRFSSSYYMPTSDVPSDTVQCQFQWLCPKRSQRKFSFVTTIFSFPFPQPETRHKARRIDLIYLAFNRFGSFVELWSQNILPRGVISPVVNKSQSIVVEHQDNWRLSIVRN